MKYWWIPGGRALPVSERAAPRQHQRFVSAYYSGQNISVHFPWLTEVVSPFISTYFQLQFSCWSFHLCRLSSYVFGFLIHFKDFVLCGLTFLSSRVKSSALSHLPEDTWPEVMPPSFKCFLGFSVLICTLAFGMAYLVLFGNLCWTAPSEELSVQSALE